jgi:hypothetical protein
LNDLGGAGVGLVARSAIRRSGLGCTLGWMLVVLWWGSLALWGVMASDVPTTQLSRVLGKSRSILKVPKPKGRAKQQELAVLDINMLAEDGFCGQVEKEKEPSQDCKDNM